MKKAILLFIIMALTACSSIIVKPKFIPKAQLLKTINKEKYPESNEYPENDNVLLYYDTKVDIYYENEAIVQLTTVHVVKKIFKNIIENSKRSIPISPDEKLIYLEGRTINNDSIYSIFGKDDISELVLKSGGEKKESKLINFTFKDVKENSILEYYYVIKSENSYLGRSHELQIEGQPIVYNNICIGINKSVYLYYMAFNIRYYRVILFSPLSITYSINCAGLKGNKEPIINKDENFSYFNWTFRDAPAFKTEDNMPPVNFIIPKIEFQPTKVDDWSDIIRHYERELLKYIPDSVNTEVVKKKNEIVKGETDILKKIGLLTDYVRSIRYENNRFGEGGIIPMKPEMVISKGYGDCKDKSYLLYSLLKSAGIKAYPALITTNDEDLNIKSDPIWKFNHMIVNVELDSNRDLWIDPTVTKCRLGEVPANIQGIGAVLIKSGKKKDEVYKQLPENNAMDNNLTFKYELNINKDEDLNFKINLIASGEYALIFRNMKTMATDNEIKDRIKLFLDDDYKDVDIKDFTFVNADSLDKPLEITFNFKSSRNTKKITKNIYSIDFDPFRSYSKSSWLRQSSVRIHPIYFNMQYSITKEAIITIGDGIKLSELPKPQEINHQFIDYSRVIFTNDEKKFEYREEFINKQIFIKADSYNEAKKVFLELKNYQSNGLVVEM